MFVLIVASFTLGAVFYDEIPARVASHWNASGEVNGYMSKFWGVFLMPIVMSVIYLFYLFIPKIDPLKKNFQTFKKTYDTFWLMLFVFFFYIFSLTLVWNLGGRFNFTYFILPAIAALFIVLGKVIKKTKRNYFFGIRTPWTLASDTVWEKTHKVGGFLFQCIGVLTLFSIFLKGNLAFFFFIIPLFLVVMFLFVYSYLIFKKINK